MKQSGTNSLTLIDIFNSSSVFNSFVYRLDTHFWQATTHPGRLRALLTDSIIRCIAGKNGDIDNSKAGSLIKKELGTSSHSVEKISNIIYEELESADFRAISEEEGFIRIALSQCAYILGIKDSQKWVSSSHNRRGGIRISGIRIKDLYENELSGIEDLSPDGEKLAEQIKASMLERIGVPLIKQCHLLDEATDGKALDAKKLLQSINPVHLLTAAIILAINYQNMGEEGINVSNLDPLSKHIRQYLLHDVNETHGKNPNQTGQKAVRIQEFDTISDKEVGNSASSSTIIHTNKTNDSTRQKVTETLQALINATNLNQVIKTKQKIRRALEIYIATVPARRFLDNPSEYGDGTQWRIQASASMMWLSSEFGKCMNIVDSLDEPEDLLAIKRAALDAIADWHITLLMVTAELTLEQQAIDLSDAMVEKENRQQRIIKLQRDYVNAETNARTSDDDFANMITRYEQGLIVDRSTI